MLASSSGGLWAKTNAPPDAEVTREAKLLLSHTLRVLPREKNGDLEPVTTVFSGMLMSGHIPTVFPHLPAAWRPNVAAMVMTLASLFVGPRHLPLRSCHPV